MVESQPKDSGQLNINYGGKTPWSLYSGYGNQTPWGTARYTPTEEGWRPLFQTGKDSWQNYMQGPSQQAAATAVPGQAPGTPGAPGAAGALNPQQSPWYQGAQQYRNAQVGDTNSLGTVVGQNDQNYLVRNAQGQEDQYAKYYFQKQGAPAPLSPAANPAETASNAPKGPQNINELFQGGTQQAGGGGAFNESSGKYDNLPQGYTFAYDSSMNADTTQPNRVIMDPQGNRYILNTENGSMQPDSVSAANHAMGRKENTDYKVGAPDLTGKNGINPPDQKPQSLQDALPNADQTLKPLGFDQSTATQSLNSLAEGLAADPSSPEYAKSNTAVQELQAAADAMTNGGGMYFSSFEAASMAAAMGLNVEKDPNSPSGYSINPAMAKQNQDLLRQIDEVLNGNINVEPSAAPEIQSLTPGPSAAGTGPGTGVSGAAAAADAAAATAEGVASEGGTAAGNAGAQADAASAAAAAGNAASSAAAAAASDAGPAAGTTDSGPAADSGSAGPSGTGEGGGTGDGGGGGGGGGGGDSVLLTWLKNQGSTLPQGLYDSALETREKFKGTPEGKRQVTRYLAIGKKITAKLDKASPRVRAAARAYLEKHLLEPLGPTFTHDEFEKGRKLFRDSLMHLADSLGVKVSADWHPEHPKYRGGK
jgi:hypothetical protein